MSVSLDELRSLAFGVSEDTAFCNRCIFSETSCCGCDCCVGNVLKNLVDEGYLSIAEGGMTRRKESKNEEV